VHPITDGVDGSYDVTGNPLNHELATAGILGPEIEPATDSGATVLAYHENVNRAAIVVDEVGDGRTAYLGSRHMANPDFGDVESLRTGDADKIFEQAVAWAAGDRSGSSAATNEDTALVIDDALANDTDADGDVLAIYLDSLQMTSAKGAAISLDANGDIVYDPTSSRELQDLSAGDIVTDSFDYTVIDGRGGADIATVRLTVAGLDEVGV
jgi:VCBS repeat-containing protein